MQFPFSLPHRVPLYLAPMAGVSEQPFRTLCRRFGADVVVTEFLSAEGIGADQEAFDDQLGIGVTGIVASQESLAIQPGQQGGHQVTLLAQGLCS
jgi:tRNA-dihydrouridine synthase